MSHAGGARSSLVRLLYGSYFFFSARYHALCPRAPHMLDFCLRFIFPPCLPDDAPFQAQRLHLPFDRARRRIHADGDACRTLPIDDLKAEMCAEQDA